MRDFIENIIGQIPDKDWNMYFENLTATKAKKGDTVLQLHMVCDTI